MPNHWKIGVLSDTHGLLRPQVLTILDGVDHIIHAGDVGGPEILTALNEVAPTTAVRGNTDKAIWADSLRETEIAVFGDSHLYVLHDLNLLDLDPVVAGSRAVITGHTHRQTFDYRNGVLFLNPGAAGRRRFADVAPSLAIITLTDDEIVPEIIELAD